MGKLNCLAAFENIKYSTYFSWYMVKHMEKNSVIRPVGLKENKNSHFIGYIQKMYSCVCVWGDVGVHKSTGSKCDPHSRHMITITTCIDEQPRHGHSAQHLHRLYIHT